MSDEEDILKPGIDYMYIFPSDLNVKHYIYRGENRWLTHMLDDAPPQMLIPKPLLKPVESEQMSKIIRYRLHCIAKSYRYMTKVALKLNVKIRHKIIKHDRGHNGREIEFYVYGDGAPYLDHRVYAFPIKDDEWELRSRNYWNAEMKETTVSERLYSGTIQELKDYFRDLLNNGDVELLEVRNERNQ